MFLSICLSGEQAEDLGYLLHKHPAKAQTFELSFGQAHIFYPEVEAQRCKACLLLDIDPIGLIRNRRLASEGRPLAQYVNDRPYVAASLMSVALGRIFSTAMGGRCKERPERVTDALDLEMELAVVAARGGEALIKQLFEPLGYQVDSQRQNLDSMGTPSPYYRLKLQGQQRLSDALNHIYILLPVLDDDKHYWIDQAEVDKLLRKGGDWLKTHPQKAMITQRYLGHKASLTRQALAQLMAEDPGPAEQAADAEEASLEKNLSLNQQRLDTVIKLVEDHDISSVLDLGCGEGKLLKALMKNKTLQKIIGADVSWRALERAQRHLRLDDLPDFERARIQLLQSSILYRDQRLQSMDAILCIEVIEHIEPYQLPALEKQLFGILAPPLIIITTPNREYNTRWESLGHRLRHRDHRFEWTRTEFSDWAAHQAKRFDYTYHWLPIGEIAPELGPPTQLGLFQKKTQGEEI